MKCPLCSYPRLKVHRFCNHCEAAYARGREEALGEVLRAALRVRGPARNGREENVGDENADGSYSAAAALLSFTRKLLARKYPHHSR